jgi:hypothetical protein
VVVTRHPNLIKDNFSEGKWVGFDSDPRLQTFAAAATASGRGGEIGRHSGLKIRRQRKTACRFKSGPRHHPREYPLT